MNKFIILVSLSIGLAFSQCDDLLEPQCIINSSCEWVITGSQTYSCSGFGNQSSCENYSEYGCSWEFSWGGWQNYGSSCVGGSFSIDSGICEEVEVPECSDMNQNECLNDESCEWVYDVQSGWCGSFNNNANACNNIDSCSYTTCQQECNWSGSAECESYPGCSYSYLTYSCSGTTTVPCCSGGSYQIDNSYCEEVSFIPGDANGDNILNVADIVLIVDLILNSEYDEYSDINQDGILNIIDIVELVNRILDN